MTTKKSNRQILDEAFAEFDAPRRVSASEGFAPVESEEEIEDTIEAPEGDSEFDGDEGDEGEVELPADDIGGEEDENAYAEDDQALADGELEGDESGEPGSEPFSLDEDADEGDDAEGAVYASVEEVEAEMQAIAREQGLHLLPKGATASETIDYLLRTEAIIELTPISASERKQRHTAFAANEFDGEETEDSVEAPVDEFEGGEDESESPELGNEFDGIDLSDIAETEDDETNDEGDDEAESSEGPGCATASVVDATQYHPLADADFIATASAGDVQMAFTPGVDPRWNVIIAGVPAACIKLSSIENGEAVRSTFCSDMYSSNLVSAMSKHGVVAVLETSNAEFYANSFKSSDLATEIRASVAEELSGEYTNRVVAMREKLLDHSGLVVAGLAKGYFAKVANPLMVKAKAVLAAHGVHPSSVDAAALEILSAAPEFFSVATEKAVELMDRGTEAVETLRENIEDAAPRAAAPASTTTASFEHRLADSTLTVAAPKHTVQASAPRTAGFDRSALAGLVGKLGVSKR
jgi:hypothetical protein